MAQFHIRTHWRVSTTFKMVRLVFANTARDASTAFATAEALANVCVAPLVTAVVAASVAAVTASFIGAFTATYVAAVALTAITSGSAALDVAALVVARGDAHRLCCRGPGVHRRPFWKSDPRFCRHRRFQKDTTAIVVIVAIKASTAVSSVRMTLVAVAISIPGSMVRRAAIAFSAIEVTYANAVALVRSIISSRRANRLVANDVSGRTV